MACLIDRKRKYVPYLERPGESRLMGPTPGTVLRSLILSVSNGSRCKELTHQSVLRFSDIVRSYPGSGAATAGNFHGPLCWSRAVRGSNPLCAIVACYGSLRSPLEDPRSDSSFALSGAPTDADSARCAGDPESLSTPCGIPAGNRSAGSLQFWRRQFGRSSFRSYDGSQHQRMRHLNPFRMWEQMIIDPAGEDRCLHRHCPCSNKSLHPAVQIVAGCSDRAFVVDPTACILYAVANRLLVNIQSDVIHNVS
jgi:hypothetical protein